MRLARILLIVALGLLPGMAPAAYESGPAFPIPDTYSLINDYHGLLTPPDAERLYAKLLALERKNGTQIVLLIVPGIGDTPLINYAQSVFDKWDVGNNGEGNGVLFLIVARPLQFYFSTGPGIAGALPDVKLRHIWEEHLDPYWRRQEWIPGIEATIDALIAASINEQTRGFELKYIEITREMQIALGLALLAIIGASLFWLTRRRKRRKQQEYGTR